MLILSVWVAEWSRVAPTSSSSINGSTDVAGSCLLSALVGAFIFKLVFYCAHSHLLAAAA